MFIYKTGFSNRGYLHGPYCIVYGFGKSLKYASNENEMNNYLNDSKYNGKFVQYIGPDGIYKNNGIYKIENKSAILYTDTTDGTASSNDILLNKIAYSNGEKLIGTIESATISLPPS